MTRKALTGILAAVTGLVIACAAGAVLLAGGGAASGCATPPGGAVPVSAPPGGWPRVGRFNPDQVGHARIIAVVGAQMGVPIRGWIIAVATAIQESDLRNLDGGAADSIGLFQQRPRQGWGTPARLRDPVDAAGTFYAKLLTVAGWQQMPVAEAANAVQRSAHPDASAAHEAEATLLINTISGNRVAARYDPELCENSCPSVVSSPVSVDGTCAGVAGVFARATSWLTAWSGGPVPYESSPDPADWFHGYRRDCSGFVSMALGLPGPGLTTSGLATHSTIITKTDLRPGDLMINPAPDLQGHVVLFERWADASTTRYYGYEQSGDGGTHYRRIPYPYFGTYPMTPYRFGKLTPKDGRSTGTVANEPVWATQPHRHSQSGLVRKIHWLLSPVDRLNRGAPRHRTRPGSIRLNSTTDSVALHQRVT